MLVVDNNDRVTVKGPFDIPNGDILLYKPNDFSEPLNLETNEEKREK